VALNACPRLQCRGRTIHSFRRHWTPAYLIEVAATISMHRDSGQCICRDGRSIVRCLWDLTVDTVRGHRRRLANWYRWHVEWHR
jgi:hypothetical protein